MTIEQALTRCKTTVEILRKLYRAGDGSNAASDAKADLIDFYEAIIRGLSTSLVYADEIGQERWKKQKPDDVRLMAEVQMKGRKKDERAKDL